MMYSKVFVICGILIAAVTAQETDVVNLAALVNCSSPNSLFLGIQKCLDLYDVPITLPDFESLSNSSTAVLSLFGQIDGNTTANLCRPENRENYIKGSLCVYKIVKKCVGDSSVMQSLIPSPQQVRKQIEFQCQAVVSGDYNQDCIISKMEEIQKCVNISTIVTSFRQNDSTVDDAVDQAFCVTFDLTRLCARKHLRSCGLSTLQLYEQNLPVPKGCDKDTDSNQGTDGEMKADCSSTWRVRKSYLTCLVNSGLDLPLPVMNSSDEMGQYIMKTVTLEKSRDMCWNLSQSSDLINCTLSVQRACIPDSLKTTVPDTQTVLKGFQQLCKHINDFDAECVSNVSMSSCNDSIPKLNISTHLCQDTRDHNKCLVDSVKSCGDVTSSQYNAILSSQLPQMCLTTDTTDNSAFKPTVSAFVLIISTVILH